MALSYSPLRYPGGKQVLARVLAHLIELNRRQGGVYAEAYAGGAGAALSLLFGEHVDRLLLNDADCTVYAFWHSVLHDTEKFLKLLRDTPVSAEEWERQRTIYLKPRRTSLLRLGFATFFLNRCNRSGIIGNAGMIGGKQQTGKWKIDARFNRTDLQRRIERIASYRERISLHNLDALEFLQKHVNVPDVANRAFVYLDPPYFVKGSQLYLNHYRPEDHSTVAKYVKREAKFLWVMSYDNVKEIRTLYTGLRQIPFNLDYSASHRKVGKELMILKKGVVFPERWSSTIPARYITVSEGVTIPLAG